MAVVSSAFYNTHQIRKIKMAVRGLKMGIQQVEIRGQTVTIHEHDDTNDSTTGRALTGSWLWDSALHLADWIQAIPTQIDLINKTVLELGAGTGLPGLTAAVLGAARVILTDVGPILPGLRKNVDINGLEGRVEVRELVWGSSSVLSDDDEIDVVLMSDVFYDRDEMGALARTLRGVCGERTRVWAASEVRASTGECLAALVEEEGFEVEEVEVTTRQLRGGNTEESSLFAVYEMRRKDVAREGENGP